MIKIHDDLIVQEEDVKFIEVNRERNVLGIHWRDESCTLIEKEQHDDTEWDLDEILKQFKKSTLNIKSPSEEYTKQRGLELCDIITKVANEQVGK